MADRGRGGRGDFRGRGRGDGDFRGRGRGGGGGDRGGGGGFHGDRGGSGGFRDDRGGFRGDRGGFRGDRGGFRGDRGGFRGDRGGSGGFRGGRGGFESVGVFGNGQFPPPDAQVTKVEDATVKDLSITLAATSLGDKLPRRPGYGKVGTPVVLWTNYFELKGINADTLLYRYSLSFQPETEMKPKKKRLVELLLQQAPFSTVPVASDWAQILVSTKKIDLGAQRPVYEIEWYPADGEPLPPPTPDESQQRAQSRKKNNYRALVEELGTVSVKELSNDLKQASAAYPLRLETIQALNVILASGPGSDRNTAIAGGNKFYPFGAHPQVISADLGSGLQALRGYFTSVRTSVNRILVNVNVATAAFYRPGPLLGLMDELRGPNRQVSLSQFKFLAGFVRKLRIETNYIREMDKNGKVKKINGRPVTKRKVHTIQNLAPIGKNSTNTTFLSKAPSGKEEQITVEQYFLRAHELKLQTPQAPLVNCGSADRPMWIPSELCTVVGGQLARRLLQGDQTRRMIEFAARRPAQNAESIVKDGLQVTKIGPTMNGHLKIFGISVEPKLLTVNGRILQPPTLKYRSIHYRPQNGAWNLDTRQLGENPFSHTKKLEGWNCLVINLARRETVPGGPDTIRQVLASFKTTLKKYGMDPTDVQEPVMVDLDSSDMDMDQMKKQISSTLKARLAGRCKFLFVLLPNESAAVYDSIKSLCDVELGIPTICSIASKFTKDKGQMQYFANLALKFNQKLGGTNHSIDPKAMSPLDDNTILFGIDVTHPSPGSSASSPSIAGVVASADKLFSQYPASMRTQEGRQEMVSDLEEMIVERLKHWQTRNQGRLPSKVIVYRDGVSESQYGIVLREEYPSFVNAFKRLYGQVGKHPKISIIVVGKRHHTRFYPTDANGTDGRTGNPKPGTVVDRGVTGEALFDFHLLAHQGLQGTSKPAHYVVLKDENRFGADQLQGLTHALCYSFARATRAVSICPPAYYADLLCERGRSYLHSVLKAGDRAEEFSGRHWTGGVHPNLAHTMFYL